MDLVGVQPINVQNLKERTKHHLLNYYPQPDVSVVNLRASYIAVPEHLVHVDALCVEDHLFVSRLCCRFTQQAAGQALGFHNDGVLGQRGQNRRQVKVNVVYRQHQLHLQTKIDSIYSKVFSYLLLQLLCKLRINVGKTGQSFIQVT